MATTSVETKTRVGEIITSYGGERHNIIAILHEIQDEFGYLPKEALKEVAKRMNIPFGQLYRTASFYSSFSLEPKGDCRIGVCTGTACYIQGAMRIVEVLRKELGIRLGETTEDRKFSLEEIRCCGCCGLAPVITIDGEIHGNVKITQIKKLLKNRERAAPLKELIAVKKNSLKEQVLVKQSVLA